MNKIQPVLAAVREHRIAAGAFAILSVLLIGAGIAILVIRSVESERLEKATSQSSRLLIEALGNPAIFTAQPEEAVAALNASADELSRVHDGVVLEKLYFAKKAGVAALQYTEYTARIGKKLTQVAQAQLHATSSFETYDRNVEILKTSSPALRGSAAEDVNSVASEARAATDLAYQECALLATLTNEYAIIKSHTLSGLKTVGPDVEPAIVALQPSLRAALELAHTRRKVFNPAARAPS